MKKSLIALAVVGAFAAPAFAATSNVDVYGKLHMSVNFMQDVANGVSDMQISSNASRIGFKGSEDLGGGLKGVWQIESGIDLDEQTGTLANRNSYLGVSGGFGTVILGNHDTPLKLIGRKIDLFGDTLADSRNVMGGGSDTRAKNVVAYMSPAMSGFSLVAAYTTDLNGTTTGTPAGSTPDDNINDAYNFSFGYEEGPIFAALAYGNGGHHSANGLDETWRVAGGFSFGDFRIVGQYDVQGSANNPVGLAGNGDYDAWMVGGEFKMGAMVFKANYMTGEYDRGTNVDPEQWTVGMDYNLSKRTSVYALYVDGTNVTLGGGASASDRTPGKVVTGDDDVAAFSVGVVHNF